MLRALSHVNLKPDYTVLYQTLILNPQPHKPETLLKPQICKKKTQAQNPKANATPSKVPEAGPAPAAPEQGARDDNSFREKGPRKVGGGGGGG